MKKVLVTGGAGYIGSVIVQKLMGLPNVELVRVIDSTPVQNPSFHEKNGKFEFVNGDLRNDLDLDRSLKGVDTVFHLAAVVGDPACDKSPERAVEINVNCVKKLINFALKNDVEKVILSSTCSVYGVQNGEEYVTEDSTPKSASLYGKTKHDAERLLMEAHRETGLGATIFRLSTIYGASLPSAMHFKIFVNLFVLHACKKKQIKVFGGANWRPLLYVGDVAKAFLIAGETSQSKVSGEIFNLGCNTENYTIRQVADIVAEEVSGTEVIEAPIPSSPSSYKVSFDKIENTFQFRPDFNLRKGVRELRDLIIDGHYGQLL